MCLVEFGIHVGAKVGELAVDDFESAVDLVKSGVHVGSEVGDLVIDVGESAVDFDKFLVNLNSLVAQILLGSWFVHALIVVVNHDRTSLSESEIVGGIHR